MTFKTPDMPTSSAMACSTASVYQSGLITITSTGFSVGSDDVVNDSGVAFFWMAFRDRFMVDYGTYVGDGGGVNYHTVNRQVVGGFVFRSTGTEKSVFKPDSLGSSLAYTFISAMTSATNEVALNATEWIAYSGVDVSSATYMWLMLYNPRGGITNCETGYYNGTGSPSSVTLGYQPKFVFIFSTDASAFKIAGMATTYAGVLTTGYNYGNDLIQIDSDGFSYDGAMAESAGYYWLAGRN
jgi:hypothetical protein